MSTAQAINRLKGDTASAAAGIATEAAARVAAEATGVPTATKATVLAILPVLAILVILSGLLSARGRDKLQRADHTDVA